MKKTLYAIIGLIIIAGIAFALSNTNLFQGSFQTPNGIISYSSSALLTKTENNRDTAETAMENAELSYNNAVDSFNNSDEDNLTYEQEQAQNYAYTAESAANAAESAVESIEENYQEAKDAYTEANDQYSNNYIVNVTDAWNEYIDLIKSFENEWPNYYNTSMYPDDLKEVWDLVDEKWSECMTASGGASYCENKYNYGTDDSWDGPTMYEAEENYNESEDTYNNWEESSDNASYYYSEDVVPYKDKKDEENAYLEAANEAAELASEYSDTAASYASDIQLFGVLDCLDLNISEKTFVMKVTANEADFDITVDLSVGVEPTDGIQISSSILDNQLSSSATADADQETIWDGTLVFSNESAGTFTYNGESNNPLEIAVDQDTSSITVSFEGGASDQIIDVYVTNEKTNCSEEIEISQELSCTETDEGLDIYNIGTISGTSYYDGSEVTDYPDTCISNEEITEYYCADSGEYEGYVYNETLNCETGYTCNEGACVEEVEEVEVVVDTNLDEDGDGVNDDEDNCVNDANADQADENGDGIGDVCEVKEETTEVETEELSCTDSDGGNEIYSPGTTIGTDYNSLEDVSVTDECIDENTILEYWCPENGDEANYVYSEEQSCGDGYACIEGSCEAEEEEITDTNEEISEDAKEILGSKEYICKDPFEDTHGHWAENIICRDYKAGVLSGRDSNSFEPDDYITRAEWIKLLVLTSGESLQSGTSFNDVVSTDWYYNYVSTAEDMGIINGENFDPNVNITRADAILFGVRAANQTLYDWTPDDIPYSDVTESDDFAYATIIANTTTIYDPNTGKEQEIMEGYSDNTFKPNNNLSRAEAAAMIQRIYLAWYQ